jgi:hypothetical protein
MADEERAVCEGGLIFSNPRHAQFLLASSLACIYTIKRSFEIKLPEAAKTRENKSMWMAILLLSWFATKSRRSHRFLSILSLYAFLK